MMNDTKPVVSICCITYNHENYIRDAIEGFLMQKTTFSIEIIIHDDASADNTAEIVRSYAEKHPDLFVTIFQAENQDSKGIKPDRIYVLPTVRGKYFALCEGDDYWTDPYKLQKQVDFLESNPDCSWCFHADRNVYVDGKVTDYIHKPKKIPKNNKFTAKDVIMGGGGFFATASAMFRAHVLKDLPDWFFRCLIGDFPLALIASSKGDIGYIDDVMCVYRKNVHGSWSHRSKSIRSSNWESSLYIVENTANYLWMFNGYSHRRFEKILKIKIIKNRYNLLLSAIRHTYLLNNLVKWIKSIKNSSIPFNAIDYLMFSYVFANMALSWVIGKKK
jgi:glycosyltransferase involved in cell wall biosynthesis